LKPINSTRSGEPAEQAGSPNLSRRSHLLHDALADVRSLEPIDPGVDPALLHPWRHRCVEPGGSRSVCIHVGGDREPFTTRRFDSVDGLPHLRPVLLTGGLQVMHLRMNIRGARDRDQFIEPSRRRSPSLRRCDV